MAYNKREFIQQATIQIGAALVKVFDESEDGVFTEDADAVLSEKAADMALELATTLEHKYMNLYEKRVFDEEL